MTTADPSASTQPDRPAWAQALYERQLATLARLTEAGLAITCAIEQEAKAVSAGEGVTPTPEALRAFEVFPRIARCVRLTLMLEDKTVRHMLGEDEPEPKGGKSQPGPADEPITEIRRIIVHRYPRGQDPDDRLTAEAGERPEYEHLPRPIRYEDVIDGVAHDVEPGTEDFGPAGEPWAWTRRSPAAQTQPRTRPAGGRGEPGDWGL